MTRNDAPSGQLDHNLSDAAEHIIVQAALDWYYGRTESDELEQKIAYAQSG